MPAGSHGWPAVLRSTSTGTICTTAACAVRGSSGWTLSPCSKASCAPRIPRRASRSFDTSRRRASPGLRAMGANRSTRTRNTCVPCRRRTAAVSRSHLGRTPTPRTGALLPRFVEGVPFDRHDRVRVWKVEEKRTDVKLALSLYRDAASGHYAQQVVCSNDSDIEPALAAVREDFPGIRVGVVIPRPPATDPSRSHRNALSALSSLADWARHHVLDPELDAAQLPLRVAIRKRPILKPAHW